MTRDTEASVLSRARSAQTNGDQEPVLERIKVVEKPSYRIGATDDAISFSKLREIQIGADDLKWVTCHALVCTTHT